jgi:hypothetical protein
MKHHASRSFWVAYERLPSSVRAQADKNFALLKADPRHRSLRLKPAGPYWSARIGLRYRALAVRKGDDFIWFWIGSHADYDSLLR